ncbi:transposase [Cellulosispirillum alkaliphilum]
MVKLCEIGHLSFKDGKVTFTYTDYKNDCKRKVMTLCAVEFIRRFL